MNTATIYVLKSNAFDNSQCMNSWWKTFIPVNWHGINTFSCHLHVKTLNTRTPIFCRWANSATTNRNKLINDNCIVALPPLQFPLCILHKQHENVIIVSVEKAQQDFCALTLETLFLNSTWSIVLTLKSLLFTHIGLSIFSSIPALYLTMVEIAYSAILTVRSSSCDKVMFSQASVILFIRGGSGRPPGQTSAGQTPREQTASRTDTPQETPLQRTACILLECILV